MEIELSNEELKALLILIDAGVRSFGLKSVSHELLSALEKMEVANNVKN